MGPLFRLDPGGADEFTPGIELLAHVATDPASVTRVLPLTSVCRYLERIGDHVKNVSESVVYMVRAQDVRHRPLPKPSN